VKTAGARPEMKPQVASSPDPSVTRQPQPKPVDRCPLCKLGRMNPVEIFESRTARGGIGAVNRPQLGALAEEASMFRNEYHTSSRPL